MFDFKEFLSQAPQKPGVYQMLSKEGDILYIGKAKNLKNRLASYRNNPANERVSLMVAKIASIVLTIAASEDEALLLENNLIKKHRPPYNILLKDDKSYPYIVLTDHASPRLMWYRGKKNNRWRFFGPYPSIDIARKTYDMLLKVFLLRSCSDQIFSNRIRPCLNYQIKQCSAPCVQIISPFDYQQSLKQAIDFLQNSSSLLIDKLEDKMLALSQDQFYEQAKEVRDHIRALRSLQRTQRIDDPEMIRLDVLAIDLPCVHHLMIIDGKIQGSQFLSLVDKLHLDSSEILEELFNRLYDDLPEYWVPAAAIVAHGSGSIKVHHSSVCVRSPKSERERAWLEMAQQSLVDNSSRLINKGSFFQKRFTDLMSLLELQSIQSIECVDISHHQGDHTVGAIVHCSPQGFIKDRYRRYTIQHEEKKLNNDVFSMHQTLLRHLIRAQEEGHLPDLLLVDGGQNQLRAALVVLDELKLTIPVLAIAKAPGRRNGEETVYRWDHAIGEVLQLSLRAQQPGFLLLQQVRDETHRFVITWQKKLQRDKSLSEPFDDFKGLGAQKKLQLIRTFGGWQGLVKVTYEQLVSIDGIGSIIAQKLLDFFKKF